MHVMVVLDRIGVQGGAEASTVAIVRGLHGVSLTFSVVCLGQPVDMDDCEQLRSAGVAVTVLPTGWWRRVWSLRSMVRKSRPDVVHAVLFDSNLLARIVAPMTRTPVLSSLVSSQYDPLAMAAAPSRWKKKLVRQSEIVSGWFGVSHFHAVSDSVALHGVRRLRIRPTKISVVERGRDAERLGRRTYARRSAVRDELGLSGDCLMVLAVARHEPAKGLMYLLEAMVRLRREIPTVRLFVAGRRGSQSRELEAFIAENGLKEYVDLLGNRSDVPDLLAGCDVFVLPSLWEGLPGAVIEAMALEAPIVASNIPGVRDAVGPGPELVPPGDSGALASALASVLGDTSATELGVQQLRARFEERFQTTMMLKGMERLYRNVASLPAPPIRSANIRTTRYHPS